MQVNSHVCDFCKAPAKYDGKTKLGPWAFMCEEHFKTLGINVPGLYSDLGHTVEETRCCSYCGEEKPLSDFYEYTDARGVKRHRNECKTCNLAERKAVSIRKMKR